MAETPSKRLRQDPHAVETFDSDESNSKRQKHYNNILSLLDEEEENEEQNQDLSAIFTTLQQELSSSSSSTATAFAFDFDSLPQAADDRQQAAEEDEGVKSVMRHLLEASDDELGIPNYTEENNDVQLKSDENISLNFFDNGLWEFEDVAANYYAVLQSELFM